MKMTAECRQRFAILVLLVLLATGGGGPTVATVRAADPPRGDVVEVVMGLGTATSFLAALRAADRVSGLRGATTPAGTLFVPDDAAFARLPAGTLETLLKPENAARLAALLDGHRVPDRALRAADLPAGKLPTAASGATLEIVRDGSKTGVTINGARLLRTDLSAGNGVVHVIDRVLLPPAP